MRALGVARARTRKAAAAGALAGSDLHRLTVAQEAARRTHDALPPGEPGADDEAVVAGIDDVNRNTLRLVVGRDREHVAAGGIRQHRRLRDYRPLCLADGDGAAREGARP